MCHLGVFLGYSVRHFLSAGLVGAAVSRANKKTLWELLSVSVLPRVGKKAGQRWVIFMFLIWGDLQKQFYPG